MSSYDHWFKRLGPGILFAGAAIGVSHLVQSTRAGGVYGLGMLLPVLLVLFVKFPSFAIGSLYSAQTGESLLDAYSKQHSAFVWLFALFAFVPFFIVLAAVTLVTSALFLAITGFQWSIILTSFVLLLICIILLQLGGYQKLDKLMKVVFIVMTISTFAATGIAISKMTFNTNLFWPENLFTSESFIFMMALLGFMPAPIDIAVLNSYWTLEKIRAKKDNNQELKLRDSWFDFRVGYIMTGILAFCFMFMGASLFFESQRVLPASAIGFSKQIINAFSVQLGTWSVGLVGVCAFTVMFSTTLSIADGYPRVMAGLYKQVFNKKSSYKKLYLGSLWFLCLGAMLLLAFFMENFKQMIDLATTLTALVSPVLALLNHFIYFGKKTNIPLQYRPLWIKVTSVFGIVVLSFLSVMFIKIKLF